MQQLVSKNSQCTGQLKVKRSNWSYLKGLQNPEEYNIHAHKKNRDVISERVVQSIKYGRKLEVGFPGGPVVKNPLAKARDMSSIPAP